MNTNDSNISTDISIDEKMTRKIILHISLGYIGTMVYLFGWGPKERLEFWFSVLTFTWLIIVIFFLYTMFLNEKKEGRKNAYEQGFRDGKTEGERIEDQSSSPK